MAVTGGFDRRQIREIRRSSVARHWRLLVVVTCSVIGLSVAVALIEAWSLRRWVEPGLVVAFIVGQGSATAVALVVALLGMDGGRSFREGREAESWTRGILDRLRRDGWQVVHDIEVDGGNIDHVLVGRHGAVAVETKFRNAGWTLTTSSIEETRFEGPPWPVRQPLAQAKRHARSLRALLLAAGIRTEVQPVLVLWGPRVTGVSAAVIDGVLVGLGGHPDKWVGLLRSRRLSDDQVRSAKKALDLRRAGEWVMTPPSEWNGLPVGESPSRLREAGAAPVRTGRAEPISAGRR